MKQNQSYIINLKVLLVFEHNAKIHLVNNDNVLT